MSYELIYDKQFVKIEDKFIPMVLIGSSNLFEYSGARVRDWSKLSIGDSSQILYTENELLSYANNIRDDYKKRYTDYNDKSFGYFSAIAIGGKGTHNTTFGMFKGIFKTGIKKALTFEQLSEVGVGIVVTNTYNKTDISNYVSERVTTKEELLSYVAECNERFKDVNVYATIEFRGMLKDSPKWIRKRYFPRVQKEKTLIEVDKYYTIKIDYDYFVKRTRNGYRFSRTPYLQYVDKKTAERRVKGLNKKYNTDKYIVEEIKEKVKLFV